MNNFLNQFFKTKKRRSGTVSSGMIFMKFFGACVLYTIVLIGGYIFCDIFLRRLTWYEWNPLYQIFKFIEQMNVLFILLCWVIGILVIFLLYWRKTLGYVNVIAEASSQLVNQDDERIILPPELHQVETYMNQVKTEAARNARLAKEAEQRKNDLIVYLAHDLKTPLTSVIGYLNLLLDEREISPQLQEKYMGIALEKAERLEDLINEFFDITRFNLTNLTLEMSKVNLTRMLEQILYEFKPLFAEKNLDYCLDVPVNVEIRCDVDKLERVFDNLIRNAVNYSFPDTVIEVTLIRREDSVIIYVKNQGNTIPPEKLERIFQQFYRVDSSRSSKTGGAGLGLAIAKEIVELHQGAITAFSENDQIQFSIYLPDHLRREEAEKSDG